MVKLIHTGKPAAFNGRFHIQIPVKGPCVIGAFHRKEGPDMEGLQKEIETFIKKMDALKSFDDDLFIQILDKTEELQEKLDSEKAKELTPSEKERLSRGLSASFEKVRAKLSFCNLH